MSDIARPRIARPLAAPGVTFTSVEQEVAEVVFDHPAWKRWWLAFLAASGLLGLLVVTLAYLFWKGVGIWGNNIPVTWALDIVGYDWWMGVACGALLTSSLLVLLGPEWRGAVNRITETVAVLAACAGGLYPIMHLGRPWFFYWNLPYPNTLALWPQFRSALYWDAVDIISLIGVALSFWYLGMLPDLASLRDRAFERAQAKGMQGMPLLRAQIYGILALGWRGSAAHWQRWSQAYRAIALMGVLVAVALQSGAAVMFAAVPEPGWHDTLQPVSFIASALLAGLGIVAAVVVLMRSVFGLQRLITVRHLGILGGCLLMAALFNVYCYAQSYFITWLTGSSYDIQGLLRRFSGQHSAAWWIVVGCALLPPQLFWAPPLRRSPTMLLGVGLLAAVGMWADHFMVIVDTLQQDFLPSSAHTYKVSIWGVTTFAGTVGLFLVLLLLFLRYMPAVSILETRRLARVAASVPVRGTSPRLRHG
jgi:Ni/Fe-hydrogenase subunit HybB-like protein